MKDLADLKGKKIAYSEGTTFQAAVLNALDKAGLSKDDVTLVNLSDPSQIPAALASGKVDVGTLTEPLVTKYSTAYKKKGAHEVAGDTVLTSGLQFVISPGDALTDRAKAAALADLSARFTKAELWLAEHKQAWVEDYYVKVQKVDKATGQAVVANNGTPSIPRYDTAVTELQKIADVLSGSGAIDKIDVSESFDTRFDAVQQEAAK